MSRSVNITTTEQELNIKIGEIFYGGEQGPAGPQGDVSLQTTNLGNFLGIDQVTGNQFSILAVPLSGGEITKLSAFCGSLSGTPTIELGIYDYAGVLLESKAATLSSVGLFTVILDDPVTLSLATPYYLSILGQTDPNSSGFAWGNNAGSSALIARSAIGSSMPSTLGAGAGTGRTYYIIAHN